MAVLMCVAYKVSSEHRWNYESSEPRSCRCTQSAEYKIESSVAQTAARTRSPFGDNPGCNRKTNR